MGGSGWCFDGVESLYDCTDVFVAGAGTVDSKTYVDLTSFTLFCYCSLVLSFSSIGDKSSIL